MKILGPARSDQMRARPVPQARVLRAGPLSPGPAPVAQCEPSRRARYRRLIGAIGAAALIAPVAAAPLAAKGPTPFERYAHRVFDQDKGLPETLVASVARTPDGYLWLGTRRGLVRSDGLRFRLFAAADTPELHSDWVNTVFTDRDGRLWIGTLRGLTVLEAGRFRHIEGPTEFTTRPINAIYQDRAGVLWLGSNGGVYTLKDGALTRVTGNPVEAVSFGEDAAGRLWVGATDRLLVARGGRLTPMPADSGGMAATVYQMTSDGQGGLWFGLQGVVRHLTVGAGARPWLGPAISIVSDATTPPISAMVRDDAGRIWVGTHTTGVTVVDQNQVFHYGAEDGLSSLEVNAMMIDPRRRVWVGTGLALDLFQPTAFTTYSYDAGFPRSLIWSTAAFPDGQLVTAADNRGLYQFTGSRASAILPPGAPNSGPTPFVITQAGSIVYALTDGRIMRRDRTGVTPVPVKLPPGAGRVYTIFEDRSGSLWFATKGGVFQEDRGTIRSITQEYGLPTNPEIRMVTDDSTGAMWFARPYLHRLRAGTLTHWQRPEGLADSSVQTLYLQGGNVWIGAGDSGLYVLRHDRIFSFGRLDRRLRSEVNGIGEDHFGNLWLTSSYGLLRVSKKDLESAADGVSTTLAIQSFDRLDGLPTTEFNSASQPSISRDAQGHLWFPSYVGVVRLDPEYIVADSAAPQVHIERLFVDGREYPLTAGHRFPPGVGRVEIEFAATDALIPKRVQVQYRLGGVGSGWIEAGERRVVSFGPLKGGRYRFQIRAANEDGRWSAGTVELPFEVGLRLYEEQWFIPLALALAGLAAVALYLHRTRRIRDRAAELTTLVEERTRALEAARESLERRVEERTAQLQEELAERKRLQHQLLQSQKLESIGRLAGGVAHEINNMMTGVLGFTEMAEQQAKNQPALVQDLRQIKVAGERAAQITRQLLTFARRQTSTRSTLNLGELIRHLERFMVRILGESIEFTLTLQPDLPSVAGDPSQLEQLLVNLIMNARDAIPGHGRVTLTAGTVLVAEVRPIGSFELLPGDYVRISVMDSGVGISPEVRARLFEPFFTTKDVNRGSGLGLAVCYGVVSQHGGAIGVESEVGKGSRFDIYLPAGAAETEAAPPPAESKLPTGSERILVVEDEMAVRLVATRTLQALGYQVVEASDGAEALEQWEARLDEIDLLLTDVVMPRLGGVDLVHALRRKRPGLPVLMMSGYVGKEAEWGIDAPLLEKPFTRAALAAAVRKELMAASIK